MCVVCCSRAITDTTPSFAQTILTGVYILLKTLFFPTSSFLGFIAEFSRHIYKCISRIAVPLKMHIAIFKKGKLFENAMQFSKYACINGMGKLGCKGLRLMSILVFKTELP